MAIPRRPVGQRQERGTTIPAKIRRLRLTFERPYFESTIRGRDRTANRNMENN